MRVDKLAIGNASNTNASAGEVRRFNIADTSLLTDSPTVSLSPRSMGMRSNDKRAYRVPTKQTKKQLVVSSNHIIGAQAKDWIVPRDIPADQFVLFFPVSASSLDTCQYQKEVVAMAECSVGDVINRLVRDKQITCKSYDAYDFHGLIVKEHSYLDEVEERCIFLVVKGSPCLLVSSHWQIPALCRICCRSYARPASLERRLLSFRFSNCRLLAP